MNAYPMRDIVLVRGKGALLYDDKDREYIDCAANVGVNNIGYGNKEIARVISEQYKELPNCYGMFHNKVRDEFARKLVELTGLKQVFFCNSGSEAVEAAIKFARATGKKKILAA